MNITIQEKDVELDEEWKKLIISAQKIGLTKEEVRAFLQKSTINNTQR